MTGTLTPEAMASLQGRLLWRRQHGLPGAGLLADLQAEGAPAEAFLHVALFQADNGVPDLGALLRWRRALGVPWDVVGRVLSLSDMAPASAAAWETRCPRTAARRLGAPAWFQQAVLAGMDPDRGRGWLRLRADPGPVRLPERLVLGRLELAGLPGLRELPRNARVANRILLEDLPRVSQWPDWLQWFSGRLEVRNCPGLTGVPRLPPWASLRLERQPLSGELLPPGPLRSLRLERIEHLERLPRCMEVQSLRVRCCPSLVALPRLLAGHCDPASPEPWAQPCSLRVQHCRSLETLPDEADYPADVHLDSCAALRSLGAGLRVGGDLRLSRLPRLRQLPAGLKVPGDLVLDDLPWLETLGAGIEIGGRLWLRKLPNLLAWPEDLQVAGDAILLEGVPDLD